MAAAAHGTCRCGGYDILLKLLRLVREKLRRDAAVLNHRYRAVVQHRPIHVMYGHDQSVVDPLAAAAACRGARSVDAIFRHLQRRGSRLL